MKRYTLITILMAIGVCPIAAQNIIVTSAEGQNVENFVRSNFLGDGVHVFNVKFNNTPGSIAKPQIGTFQSNGFTGAQMNEGIVLTTGHVSVAEGPNDNGHAAQAVSNYFSDPLMTVVSSGNIRSCATLDFDLVCLSDHVSFTYCFGSEEYPEFVGSTFNDVFAFFLSGTDPSTGLYTTRNIALVPGSVSEEYPDGIAVAINSVNSGVTGSSGSTGTNIHPEFSHYYVENAEGADGVQYNGYTMKLMAEGNLVPCEVYHMHISICNIGDLNRDSGVMLEGHSLSSPSVTTGLSTDNIITFGRRAGREVPLTLAGTIYNEGRVHLSFGGELANGVDFVCTTDSGDTINTSHDYLYINEETHSFMLRGTDSADLTVPRSIEVYMATELCPQYPELLVYDTLRFTMIDDTPDPNGINTLCNGIPLAIFPNPASETLTVATDGLRVVELFDIQGRMVATAYAEGPILAIDIRQLPAGIYTLRAVTDSGIGNTQVIIQQKK